MSAEISLWLDTYDDLYSDFDSRHYRKRRISEDFIEELKMSLKYREDPPRALALLLPAGSRDTTLEAAIQVNIEQQLLDRLTSLKLKVRKIARRAVLMLATGMALMTTCVVLQAKMDQVYLLALIRSLPEPAAWFMIWTGLDAFIYHYRKAVQEQSFYHTLSRLTIYFGDIKVQENA